MRIAVGLLACLGTGLATAALAEPPTATAPTATTAPAPAAASPATDATADAATVKVVAEKVELDKETRHFLAEGYKPEMRRGEQIYCKKETALGSRLTQVKRCGTLEQLKLNEEEAKTNVADTQRAQVGTSFH